MRVGHADELGAHGLHLGGVDADAGAARDVVATSRTSKMRRLPATMAGRRPR